MHGLSVCAKNSLTKYRTQLIRVYFLIISNVHTIDHGLYIYTYCKPHRYISCEIQDTGREVKAWNKSGKDRDRIRAQY